ncbi:hypothetical protein OG2516_11986 [Oceanicola granulosus HTCC2516]|uniref:L,D-TPase catalytic domain-containing protein n=1 Tax=Oceanicola granulosus (strain ATCC BAA-861 / DSM 15982 / KCTC 12143 / HTCC2516) TaxID=314256 RepID=Q2CBC7_OCEGH|nr:L,D-transpeptidase family protein [Oceanicola granulosus]EAR49971.1 hypothetical protein OG2516_11986 [Oceanicola granulosus HTCC2516]
MRSPADLVVGPGGLDFLGRRYPCVVGRGGVTDTKREGDGATPRGTHRIVGMLYRPDRIPPPAPWAEPIGPGDLWSDEAQDAAYNSHVRAPYPCSHETLRRADPLYDLVLVTDWNYDPAIPGLGSAIFVHQWRRPGYPTEGCVALRRRDLHEIAARVLPGTRLIVL